MQSDTRVECGPCCFCGVLIVTTNVDPCRLTVATVEGKWQRRASTGAEASTTVVRQRSATALSTEIAALPHGGGIYNGGAVTLLTVSLLQPLRHQSSSSSSPFPRSRFVMGWPPAAGAFSTGGRLFSASFPPCSKAGVLSPIRNAVSTHCPGRCGGTWHG